MGMCSRCQRALIEVPVKVGDELLTIIRCSTCDDHRWERDGVAVDLTEVLDLTERATAERTKARARPAAP